MTRIVQLANFYGPESGGLRTVLDELARGYHALGIERCLIVPGPADEECLDEYGAVITMRSPRLPWSGGYRVIVRRSEVAARLRSMRPDRVEVSDKLSLAWVAEWAADAGVTSLLFSHERLDAILAPRVPGWFPLVRCADRRNQGLARRFERVVCTSGFSAAEFDRLGAANVTRVPLGVDLDVFAPNGANRAAKRTELLYLGRLSKEKRPALAVEVLRALVAEGADAHLTIAGAGPLANDLAKVSAGLPVTLLGHVHGRPAVASLLRQADAVLAPCPSETFGLAVLEALACGTPVVTSDQGGAQELIDEGCGRVASDDPAAWAEAVHVTTQLPHAGRRARARAESYPWSRTVAGMLCAHDLPEVTACA